MPSKFWETAPPGFKARSELEARAKKLAQDEGTAFDQATGGAGFSQPIRPQPSNLSQKLRTGRVLPSQPAQNRPKFQGPTPTPGGSGFTSTRAAQPRIVHEPLQIQEKPLMQAHGFTPPNPLQIAARNVKDTLVGNVTDVGKTVIGSVAASHPEWQPGLKKKGLLPGEEPTLGGTVAGLAGFMGRAYTPDEIAGNPLLALGPEAQIAGDIAMKAAGPALKQVVQGVKSYPSNLVKAQPRIVPERQALGLAKKVEKAGEVKIGEVIARETTPQGTFEYQIAKNVQPDAPQLKYQVQMRVANPNGTYSEWESAYQGWHMTPEQAAKGFADRYRGDISNVEILDSLVKQGVDEKIAIANEAQRVASEKAAQESLKAQADSARYAQIRDEVKGVKFSMADTPIAGPEGKVTSTERGPSLNGLVITTVGDGKWKRWNITHQGSGLLVADNFKSANEAKIAVYRLTQLTDWTQSVEDIAKKKIRASVHRLQNDVYSELPDLPSTPKPSQARAVPPAAKAGQAKEPWGMTGEEFHTARFNSSFIVSELPEVKEYNSLVKASLDNMFGNQAKAALPEATAKAEAAIDGKFGAGSGQRYLMSHKEQVQQAHAAGKPVPAEVLAEYGLEAKSTERLPKVQQPQAPLSKAEPTAPSVGAAPAAESVGVKGAVPTVPPSQARSPQVAAPVGEGIPPSLTYRKYNNGTHHVEAVDAQGNVIGAGNFIDKGDGLKYEPGGILWVEPAYRRQGIASAILDKAQEVTGKKLIPGGTRTGEGAALTDKYFAPKAAPGPRIPDEAPSIEGVGFPQREAPLTVEGAGEAAMPPFGPADSGVPPVVPPTTGSPTGAAPRGPSGPTAKSVPQGIQDDLRQATATVVRDRAGIITRLTDRIPGLKLLQRHIHPAVGMPENILAGHVGSGATAAKLSNKLRADVTLSVKQLDTAFGRNAVSGKATNVARFIGPPEKQVPFSGTLYDVMQRPDMYDLTTEQRALLTDLQASRSETFNALKEQYGLKIREFPVPEGAVHLGNVSQTKGAIDMAGSLESAVKRGANKERVWPTGADRYLHDKATKTDPATWFKPVTDVGALMSMRADQQLINEASQNVLKAGLGGKTKLEVLTETHPELANRMQGLKNRLARLQGYGKLLKDEQQEAIDDFLTGAMEDADLTQLYDDLNVKLEPGRYVAKSQAGRTLADVTQEINGVKADITKLRPEWRNANPEPYVMVTEGNLYQYYPSAEAPIIRKLMERSNHWGFRAADNLRATAFGGDLSPASIQGVTSMLLDPLRTGRALVEVGPKRLFSADAMAADIRANFESWQRFTNATGMNPLAGPGEEFSTGFVGKIPKVGKYWARFNDVVYRPTQWTMKKSFDSIYADGLKMGLTNEQAAAIAADDVTKLIPQYNFRRLGMSSAQSTRYRAVLTSVSFLTQPAALMTDATKGLIKLGTRQTVTPSEAYAVKRVLTLVAAVETIAVTSHVAYARLNGKDETQALKESLDPTSGYFMSAVLPNGARFGLGGPYRSLIKAVWPAEVKGAGPVPLPFAGIVRFARSKANVGVSLAIDLARNQDYYGQKIMQGDFPINILQGAEYAMENTLPLTIGSAMEQVRRGTPENIPSAMGSQFAGVNLVDEAPPSVWKAAEETNKTFRRLPYMSKYDVNLGSIGSTWDNIVMTPEQRIIRQNTMGAVVTPRMKAFVESPSFAKMNPDEQQTAIDKEMDRIKGMLTKVYNAYGKGEPAPDLTGKMAPTIKDLTAAEVERHVLGIESLKPYFDIKESTFTQYGKRVVPNGKNGTTTLKNFIENTEALIKKARDMTGKELAAAQVEIRVNKASSAWRTFDKLVKKKKLQWRMQHPENGDILWKYHGIKPIGR